MFFLNKIYSQKYQFDCITFENNNGMIHIISDTICKNAYKDFKVFRIQKKDHIKKSSSSQYYYDRGRNLIRVC